MCISIHGLFIGVQKKVWLHWSTWYSPSRQPTSIFPACIEIPGVTIVCQVAVVVVFDSLLHQNQVFSFNSEDNEKDLIVFISG